MFKKLTLYAIVAILFGSSIASATSPAPGTQQIDQDITASSEFRVEDNRTYVTKSVSGEFIAVNPGGHLPVINMLYEVVNDGKDIPEFYAKQGFKLLKFPGTGKSLTVTVPWAVVKCNRRGSLISDPIVEAKIGDNEEDVVVLNYWPSEDFFTEVKGKQRGLILGEAVVTNDFIDRIRSLKGPIYEAIYQIKKRTNTKRVITLYRERLITYGAGNHLNGGTGAGAMHGPESNAAELVTTTVVGTGNGYNQGSTTKVFDVIAVALN